jgi:hypothetical protein
VKATRRKRLQLFCFAPARQQSNLEGGVMKLNSAQVERTLDQFEAQALPDNHPAVPQLNKLFGEHTFFLDSSGLNVLEPVDAPEMETQSGKVVNVAYWSDDNLTKLTPHEPEPTGVVVILESRH